MSALREHLAACVRCKGEEPCERFDELLETLPGESLVFDLLASYAVGENAIAAQRSRARKARAAGAKGT